MIPQDATPPPCAGQHDLFDSRRWEHHVKARELCKTCPIFAACVANLEAVKAADKAVGGSPQGTWAGQLMGQAWRPTGRRYKCGSEKSYHQHRTYGEKPCDACKAAHAKKERDRAKYVREQARRDVLRQAADPVQRERLARYGAAS